MVEPKFKFPPVDPLKFGKKLPFAPTTSSLKVSKLNACCLMLMLFFNYAMLGGILAYGVYKLWIDVYCHMRHKQEYRY